MKVERDEAPESPHTREVREVESKGSPVLSPSPMPEAWQTGTWWLSNVQNNFSSVANWNASN